MKKLLLIPLIIILISTLVLGSCGEEEVKGGILRVISAQGVNNMGYPPEMQMADEFSAKTYAETLLSWDGTGEFVPALAESYELDEENMTITFKLRKGVKFHDGTDWNAEAAKWNLEEMFLKAGRLTKGQYVKEIEVVDDYTLRYHLTKWFAPSIMLHSYAYSVTFYSPTAFKENGKEWCISHYVSTGPFKFSDFKRDVYLKIERFDDYWRGGEYPYLDGIEFTFISDPMTASAMMQAGDADMWDGPILKEAVDLEALGFVIKAQNNMFSQIVPNTKSPDSMFRDKRIREAIEYAIDREAIAEALGFGKLHAMEMMAPEGTQGYNPDYPGRPYNPDKARELLAEAGYPNGFKTTMMVLQGDTDLPVAIQTYLAEVNIELELDVADPGRYFSSHYGTGWNDLIFSSTPVDPEYAIGWLVHHGPEPIVFYASVEWPAEYLELCENVLSATDVEGMRQATMDMVTFASEEAIIIPVIDSLGSSIVRAPYLHTSRLDDHFMVWNSYLDWMEEH